MLRKWTCAALALSVAFTGPAFAVYPERPITLIMPATPGGGTDTGIRTWQPFVEACLGEGATFALVPRPGAGGAVAWTELVQQPADGYTLGVAFTPNLYTQIIEKEQAWTLDSFDYIGALVGSNSVVGVRGDSPMQGLDDLIEAAKAADQPINVGLSGLGNGDHLLMLVLGKQNGISFNYIPFEDGSSNRNALLGGHIGVTAMSNANLVPFDTEIRAIGIASEERSPMTPDVATFKEQGYDLVAASSHVIMAPKGIPEEALTKLRDCFTQTSTNEEFVAVAKERSVPVLFISGESLDGFLRADEALYRELWQTNPWVGE